MSSRYQASRYLARTMQSQTPSNQSIKRWSTYDRFRIYVLAFLQTHYCCV